MKTDRPILIITGLALLAFVVLLDSCSKSSDPAKPVASFTYTCSGFTCSFNASASSNATSYSWAFGDGATGAGVTTSHTFGSRKSYTVTLTATGSGGSNATSKPISCNQKRCQ